MMDHADPILPISNGSGGGAAGAAGFGFVSLGGGFNGRRSVVKRDMLLAFQSEAN
jgi:hypothetical protein